MHPTNPNGQIDFSDLPSDMSLDDLFQDEPRSVATSLEPTPVGTPAVQPTQPQAAPAPVGPSWEPIRTSKSIYETREDAIRGIEHKDALLEQLRQDAIARTGVDPVTRKPVQQQPQADAQYQGYLQNPDRYMQDLVNGAENSPQKYVESQLQLFNEYLAPLGPAIQDIVRTRAEKLVSQDLPDFESVRRSPDFNAVLDELPDLKQAILGAENNFQAADKLPGLYKIAYLAARGRQLPELLKTQAASTAAPTQARPSLTPSAGTPPASQGGVAPSPLTPEGRRAMFERMEQSGVLDRKF